MPDSVIKFLNVIHTELNSEEFAEFRSLVSKLDDPSLLLTPEDILALVGNAMFNVGSISLEEIDRVNKEIRQAAGDSS